MLYRSCGNLSYSMIGDAYRLVLNIDKEIVRYYQYFIPKNVLYQKQMWPAHITVVRVYKEIPSNLNYWQKHENKLISFEYDNEIYFDDNYIWLKAYSLDLENVRKELGLNNIDSFNNVMYPFSKTFHISLGNKKKN